MMLKWHVTSIIPTLQNHRHIYYDVSTKTRASLSEKSIITYCSPLASYYWGCEVSKVTLGDNLESEFKSDSRGKHRERKMYRGNAMKENERIETGSKIIRVTKR